MGLEREGLTSTTPYPPRFVPPLRRRCVRLPLRAWLRRPNETGNIPSELGMLSSLEYLELDGNDGLTAGAAHANPPLEGLLGFLRLVF